MNRCSDNHKWVETTQSIFQCNIYMVLLLVWGKGDKYLFHCLALFTHKAHILCLRFIAYEASPACWLGVYLGNTSNSYWGEEAIYRATIMVSNHRHNYWRCPL